MAVPREHLIKRTVSEIVYLLLGRHAPEERARILEMVTERLKEKR